MREKRVVREKRSENKSNERHWDRQKTERQKAREKDANLIINNTFCQTEDKLCNF